VWLNNNFQHQDWTKREWYRFEWFIERTLKIWISTQNRIVIKFTKRSGNSKVIMPVYTHQLLWTCVYWKPKRLGKIIRERSVRLYFENYTLYIHTSSNDCFYKSTSLKWWSITIVLFTVNRKKPFDRNTFLKMYNTQHLHWHYFYEHIYISNKK